MSHLAVDMIVSAHAFHSLRKIGDDSSRPRTNRRARCNAIVMPGELQGFYLLYSQLSMAEIIQACGYVRPHVWYLLHVHGSQSRLSGTGAIIDAGKSRTTI